MSRRVRVRVTFGPHEVISEEAAQSWVGALVDVTETFTDWKNTVGVAEVKSVRRLGAGSAVELELEAFDEIVARSLEEGGGIGS